MGSENIGINDTKKKTFVRNRARNEVRRGGSNASANKPTSLIAKIKTSSKVKGQTN